MQILGYVVYAVAALLTATFLFGIRVDAARGARVFKGSANVTLLFVLSLLIIPAASLSPLHLLWLFPASWVFGTVLGMLSRLFPFSLFSFPGQCLFRLVCIGVDFNDDGLFRESLKTYFTARRSGKSLDQALAAMVEARYAVSRPDLPEPGATKRRLMEGLVQGSESPERVRVVTTVLMMWRHEHDVWSGESRGDAELYSRVNRMYEDIALSHGFPESELGSGSVQQTTSAGIVVCPSCARRNRVPADKSRAAAVCSVCRAKLFSVV